MLLSAGLTMSCCVLDGPCCLMLAVLCAFVGPCCLVLAVLIAVVCFLPVLLSAGLAMSCYVLVGPCCFLLRSVLALSLCSLLRHRVTLDPSYSHN